ncbi:MAG TPA: FAD:protein FMN transferase [Fimbriiglobus sp.]|nr:FAD:protein FMN transferase [Fimbriiglobus sp.]
MNRRRFLRTKPLAGAGSILLPAPETEPTPGGLTLIRVSRRAMATRFEVALPYGTPDALAAAEDALDLIDDLEDQLTVYRDHSEVSRLNASAPAGPVVVEPNLFDLLAFSVALTNGTAGAFDIATGSLIKAWGFFKREGRVPPPRELADARARSGMRHVILNADARTVKYRRAGLEINLGGIGKGYALDLAADLLRRKWGVASALLHGGGSSVRALGTPPGQPRGWPVAVRHPWDDARTLGTVWLRDEGFGTSAATFQYFEYKGRKLGHLLDPRTGWPAAGTASASVVAPTAAAADALSTAFFVLGAAGAAAHCTPRPSLGAVVLPEDDPPTTVGLDATRYDPPTARTIPD